jgi:hypothetical protein
MQTLLPAWVRRGLHRARAPLLPAHRNGEVRVGRELVSDRQPTGLDHVEREVVNERQDFLILLEVLVVLLGGAHGLLAIVRRLDLGFLRLQYHQ